MLFLNNRFIPKVHPLSPFESNFLLVGLVENRTICWYSNRSLRMVIFTKNPPMLWGLLQNFTGFQNSPSLTPACSQMTIHSRDSGFCCWDDDRDDLTDILGHASWTCIRYAMVLGCTRRLVLAWHSCYRYCTCTNIYCNIIPYASIGMACMLLTTDHDMNCHWIVDGGIVWMVELRWTTQQSSVGGMSEISIHSLLATGIGRCRTGFQASKATALVTQLRHAAWVRLALLGGGRLQILLSEFINTTLYTSRWNRVQEIAQTRIVIGL